MALDKNKKQLIMVGVLVLVLILASINAFRGEKSPGTKETKETSPSAQAPADTQASASLLQQPTIGGFAPPDEKIIRLQLARIATEEPPKNPFYPIGKRATFKRGSLVLKGISWNERGKSFVLINEEIVKVGDTIGDSKIVRIEKNLVVLEKDAQEYILMLEEDNESR